MLTELISVATTAGLTWWFHPAAVRQRRLNGLLRELRHVQRQMRELERAPETPASTRRLTDLTDRWIRLRDALLHRLLDR